VISRTHIYEKEMAKSILMEEIHVSLLVPASLPDVRCRAIRRTLNGAKFQAELRRAISLIVRRQPALKSVRPVISR
jgi:hypothetical protein